MSERSSVSRWSRESRILLLTVALCAGVLLALARLRFPDTPAPPVAAPPLERLAARASYDALAGDIQRVEPIINANLVVLRVAARLPDVPRTGRDALETTTSAAPVTHVAALRTGADTALAFMGPAVRILGVIGGSDTSPASSLVQRDAVRHWALLRVPVAPASPLKRRALADLPTPTYVVVVEGTQAGTTLRPVFLGQGTRFTSARWTRPLLPLGGIAVSPGALLFTLDGEFVGGVTIDGGAPAIVGERDLFDAATRLANGEGDQVGDIGIAVQALTPELSQALSAAHGVVVASVDREGPSASILAAGDVITGIAGHTVAFTDDLLLDVARRRPGETIDVAFARAGDARSATITIRAAAPASRVVTPVNLVRVPTAGTRVEAGRQRFIEGLEVGDLVTRAGAVDAPTPAQLRAVLAEPNPTGFVTLVVQRQGQPRVIAVRATTESDAVAR